MSSPFRSQIRSALADPSLGEALDINFERSLAATANASSILYNDLDELRRKAHAIKAETIANLEQYLEQFIQRASANGMIVHQAQDAQEANEIVRGIIRQAGGKVIAKSKTMVSEETQLNTALEADGLQVVETDLGEYIVQLRGEPPAHIIAPAVHLTRRQVGLTFQEKLGLPYTEDIPTLTAAARKELRQTFLRADIGISGVNFGVAETGGICLLTNEGNGRMATTLPDVHIALMGIERLVPNLADLAVMLDLLPYAATGQRLTVYTSLIHGPRRAGEIDGPRQRHLVLLDNGRRAMRNSELAEMLYCIRCGACLNVCPVFREIGGHAYVGVSGKHTPYPGPMGSVISPALFGAAEFGDLARATSLCGACQEACPVDIPLPKLLLRVRAAGAEQPVHEAMMPKERTIENAARTAAATDGQSTRAEASTRASLAESPAQPASSTDIQPPAARQPMQQQEFRQHVPLTLRLGLRLFTWAAESAARFNAVQRSAGAVSRLFAPRSEWLRLPAFTGWGASRDFPRPAAKPFHEMVEELQRQPAPSESKWIKTRFVDPSEGVSTPDSRAASQALTDPANAAAAMKSAQTPAQIAEVFDRQLQALGGSFYRCSASEAGEQILQLLRQEGVEKIQAWESAFLPVEIVDRLQQAGISVAQNPDPELRAGLTGAVAGAAHSASLLLTAAPGRPLTASLLPEIHIAVVKAADLYPHVSDLLALEEVRRASSAVLVSGPSRTADIEMSLTIGVHGPRQIHVFCVD